MSRLARERSGAAAIEFALTGAAFVGLMLFVIALGFRLYVQVALNYAAARASRLLAVDSTQSRTQSPGSFQTVTLCPLLSPFLSCNNLVISLQAVTDYRTGSMVGGGGSMPFSPGQGGSLMLLKLTYLLPSLSWPIPTGDGTFASFAGATLTVGYPYQNEY